MTTSDSNKPKKSQENLRFKNFSTDAMLNLTNPQKLPPQYARASHVAEAHASHMATAHSEMREGKLTECLIYGWFDISFD